MSDTNEQPSLTRRDVLVALGSLGLVGVAAGLTRGTLRFLTPPVSLARPVLLVAGPPTDFPPDSLTPLPGGPAWIGRDAGGLFAVSAICPHLGCTVARTGDSLACPCHGSRFALDGARQTGPAPGPLPHLALALNDAGLLEVNLAEIVADSARLVV